MGPASRGEVAGHDVNSGIEIGNEAGERHWDSTLIELRRQVIARIRLLSSLSGTTSTLLIGSIPLDTAKVVSRLFGSALGHR
jgi:hypothetical protein